MKYQPIYTYILLIIFIISTILLGSYMGRIMSKNRESMRTLPRPTRHPLRPIDRDGAPILGAYQSETMNQFIDRNISNYFDDSGVPYTNTVESYKSRCVDNGNVLLNMKSKLTDVGYYILDIVIPNIPTVKNPKPTVYWPAIQWSGMPPFAVHISPRPTYLIYADSNSFADQFSMYSSTWNTHITNKNAYSGGTTDGTSGVSGSSSSSSSTPTEPSAEQKCGVCSSCMATALGMSDTCNSNTDENSGSSGSSGTTGTTTSNDKKSSVTTTVGKNGLISYTANSQNQSSPSTSIGANVVYGYTITDASQNNIEIPSPLNELITNDIINKYFIEKGPNQGKPTQAAIDLFNEYTQGRQPMDDFHKNKLRDVVYYVMQNIIPGLPTSELPRSYVEWIPIRWLSKGSPGSL